MEGINELETKELNQIVKGLEKEGKKRKKIRELNIVKDEKDILLGFLEMGKIKNSLLQNFDKINYLGRVVTMNLLNKNVIVKSIKQNDSHSFCLRLQLKIQETDEVHVLIQDVLKEYYNLQFFNVNTWKTTKTVNIRINKIKKRR